MPFELLCYEKFLLFIILKVFVFMWMLLEGSFISKV